MSTRTTLFEIAQTADNALKVYYDILRLVNANAAIDFSNVTNTDPAIIASGLSKAQWGSAYAVLTAFKTALEDNSNEDLYALLRAANVETE